MKKIFLILAFVGFGLSNADAQKVIPDVHKTCKEQDYRRTEIILPQVDGYNCYKADLHTHTIYSDGEMTPREKVREAWYDGLDILAITDHLESRRYSQYMLNALAPYNPDGKPYKYHHAGSAKLQKDGTDAGIKTDMNATFDEAKEYLEKEGYPITLIKGVEISRKPQTEGHFNALFVKDINALYKPTTLPRPWHSPGKNTGVGCHFLLQCMKVKSESEATQSCPTPSDPMDCSPPGSSTHGIFQARVLEISGWRSVCQPREPKGRNTFRRLINSGAKGHKADRNKHTVFC